MRHRYDWPLIKIYGLLIYIMSGNEYESGNVIIVTPPLSESNYVEAAIVLQWLTIRMY